MIEIRPFQADFAPVTKLFYHLSDSAGHVLVAASLGLVVVDLSAPAVCEEGAGGARLDLGLGPSSHVLKRHTLFACLIDNLDGAL